MYYKKQKYKQWLVRKDMDVNEHERLFNFTLQHKLKQRNSAFIAICIKPHRWKTCFFK